MATADSAIAALTRPDRYPRSSRYDPHWLLTLDMGPHPLWLLEDLLQDLDLRPGMRILDLGAGKGATSVFLAREYDAEVVSTDWWLPEGTAEEIFTAAGVADQVTAVHTEAHTLPFPDEAFDAILCIDAYEYFGTADSYLPYLTRFLRPKGQLGIATPALNREPRDLGTIPAHIKAVVGWEAAAWHTPDWWRFHWEITDLVTVTTARPHPEGWHDWLLWTRALAEHRPEQAQEQQAVVEMLEADGGELLGFAMVTARKR
ncbi:cyclopropane-fatty-acyl-phospholipid synthase family protein [Catenulispora yoronensis]|uniref:Cyclopropane-fatty-acyl-phospholipid synthase family protein n=1 Tax=Catenulispora yoronensis TaxID=450799 RepID=A0ABP5F0S2_9ACTN